MDCKFGLEALAPGGAIAAATLFVASTAIAHPHSYDHNGHDHSGGYVHENGNGPDPDRDTNPATITGGISVIGDAAEAADDPPYAVITFEAPPGSHGDTIKKAYKEEYGVSFFPEIKRQLCVGQRHFQYNSMCTYEAAPSGRFAASYMDYLNRPLIIDFDRPVCVVTMAIYPTGGKEGEEFELKIEGWNAAGDKLEDVAIDFEWTKDTVRWRHMAGAYYLGERASKIAVSMKSKDAKEKKEVLRYLIDDLAIVETGCEEALAEIRAREGDPLDEQEDGALDGAEPAETGETIISMAVSDPE